MSKKEKREVENKQESNKGKKFFYIFLSILSVVMIAMAIVSFIHGEPKYAISNGIIFVFALIAILLVFDSIESLNVGNVLSLKTKVKEKEKEVDKLNAENTQLRNQFISVMTTTMNKQNVYVGYSKDYIVEKAEKKDSEEEETPTRETEHTAPSASVSDGRTYSYQKRRAIHNRLEELLFSRFKNENAIAEANIRRDVKITNIGVSSDPIIEKDVIYDAYVKRPMDELFIEISANMSSRILFDFRLYFMISRVFYYSQANKVKAKMILVLPKFSDAYIQKNTELMRAYDLNRAVPKIKEIYEPAIQNDLLEIVEIDISDDEIKQIEDEATN